MTGCLHFDRRCLAEKLADPDFGQACRMEVIVKLQRRQANWRLDPALRRACKADVAELCKLEDGRGSETGEVYRCLGGRGASSTYIVLSSGWWVKWLVECLVAWAGAET